MELAPIALFVYNRPWHTRQTLTALQKNELARESELFVFSDAARNDRERSAVEEVRRYVKSAGGFRKLTVIERESNFGPAKSIISAVTEIVGRFGRVIVLEDDLLTSEFFLAYMNEALEAYKNEDRVISVCGYMYPVRITGATTVFLRLTDCWGWATWKRGWDLFEPDPRKLAADLMRKGKSREFDLDGAYGFARMLKKQAGGKVDSWVIRWYASSFLADRLSLYPYLPLVKNIGMDNTGVHSGVTGAYDAVLCNARIPVGQIEIAENKAASGQIRKFFRMNNRNIARRLMNKLIRMGRFPGAK